MIILHDDKYQRFLEADTFIFDGHSQVSPDYPKQQVFNIICYISEKKKIMKLFFCMLINKPFYKLMLSILVSMASNTQSTGSNKFGTPLQYFKKDIRDEGDFCTDKHQSFQQVVTIIFDGCGKTCLKYSKQQVCNIFVIN